MKSTSSPPIKGCCPRRSSGQDPVKREIGKGSLSTPTARNIQVVNQLLNALTNFFVTEIVDTDKRSQIGVEGAESLSSGPFILHRSEEIDDLTDGGSQMLGGTGFNFAGTPFRPSFKRVRKDQPAQ